MIPDLEYGARLDFKLLFSIKLKPAETYDAQTIRLAQKPEGRKGPGGTASDKTNASKPANGAPKRDPADAKQKAAQSPRDSSKQESGSDFLKRIREAAEPILAEMAEKHGYRLTPAQSIHRVAPPFDPIRMTYYRVGNPWQSKAIPAGPSAISFRWEGNALHHWGMTFGGSPHDGYSLIGVADAIQGLKSQQIVGPPELLNPPIPAIGSRAPALRMKRSLTSCNRSCETSSSSPSGCNSALNAAKSMLQRDSSDLLPFRASAVRRSSIWKTKPRQCTRCRFRQATRAEQRGRGRHGRFCRVSALARPLDRHADRG